MTNRASTTTAARPLGATRLPRLLLAASLLTAYSARADTVTFNPGIIPGGSTAPWNTTTANWLNGATSVLWPNTAADTAIFGGTGVGVSIQGAGVSAGNLTFQTNGWSLGGGSLTLAGAGGSTISTGTSVTSTISAAVLNGFTKTGTGTLILANTSATNTGNVTVSVGTLKMGAANQIADSATLTIASGATFDLAGFNDTFGLSASSAGAITTTGAGATLTFNNTTAFTYSGVLTGSLSLQDTVNSLGMTLAGSTTNTGNGTTIFNALVTNYFNKTSGNAVGGNLTLAGGGVTLLAANQISDTGNVFIDVSKATAIFRLNGFNESIGALNSTGTADANAHVDLGSGTLTITGATGSTFGGIIAGAGGLIKQGNNNLTLSGANTFTGGMSVTGGTLVINADAALGTSGATYAPLTLDGGAINGGNTSVALNAGRSVFVGAGGATFNINSGTTFTLGNVVTNLAGTESNPGSIAKSSLGTLSTQATSGTPFGTGSILLNAGTLAFNPSGTGANVGLAGASGTTDSSLTYGIGSALALTKGSQTSLTLTLGNAAPASSVLVRSGAGTLLLQPTATANLGGTEKLIVNGTVATTNGILNPSVIVQDKTANATLRGDFVANAGGTTGLQAATYTDTNFAAASGPSIEQVTANTTLGASSQIHAIKVGNGGNNLAPVALTINSGQTLTVGNGSGQSGVILNGTTGTGAGTAKITGGTLAFGGAEGMIYVGTGGGTISSAITGSASGNGLTVFGSGVLTLSGANTYSGITNINSAANNGVTLQAGATNALPSGTTVNVNNGSILALNNFSQTVAQLTGVSSVTLGTGSLTVGDSGNFSYSGVISGSGGLIKNGSGTMTIGGANTFTGGTSISTGTLQLSVGSNRLATGGNVAIGSSAFLDLNGQSQAVDKLTGAGTVTNSGTGTPLLTVGNANSSFTLDPTIAGGLAFTKAGTGTVVVSSANSYTGATTIAAGKLVASNATGSATGSGLVTVNVGATLGGSGTVGAVSVNGTISPGNSPGTLATGSETWNGGGAYLWEVNDATGTRGADPGYDWLNIGGTLTINSTAGSRFTIQVASLTLGNVAGNAANFNPLIDQSWTIATASGGITGFASDKFVINTSAFVNGVSNGSWSVSLIDTGSIDSLVLNFAAVPEPATWGATIGFGLFVLILIRRRRAC